MSRGIAGLCQVRAIGRGGWYCTREKGHDGEHIAAVGVYEPGAKVECRWNDSEETATALRACAEARPSTEDPSIEECLRELARVRAENERLQRLAQTHRPELEQLRRVVTAIRDLHNNVPRQIEHLLEDANALLATNNDDLPSLAELRGILSDGKSRVDAALQWRAEALAPHPQHVDTKEDTCPICGQWYGVHAQRLATADEIPIVAAALARSAPAEKLEAEKNDEELAR